jgi:transposase-like protein
MEIIADVDQSKLATRRRVFTPEQRREVLTRYHQSQLPQQEFVAQEGISLGALSKWLTAEKRQKQSLIAPKPISFQEVKLPLSRPGWVLEVSNPKGWTLRLSEVAPATTLQQLLGALPC